MVLYPSTNILLSPLDGLDSKARKCLHEIETYLEINGTSFSQSSDNIDRQCKTEKHYFMGTSVVKINTFRNKADIKIMSINESYLSNLKKNIETMLK